MRAAESYNLQNVDAATYGPIILTGGRYQLSAHATWGGGSLKLEQLLPDNTTYFALFGSPSSATPNTFVASLAADGVLYFDLPPGTYELVYATGTALYASLARVPLE